MPHRQNTQIFADARPACQVPPARLFDLKLCSLLTSGFMDWRVYLGGRAYLAAVKLTETMFEKRTGRKPNLVHALDARNLCWGTA